MILHQYNSASYLDVKIREFWTTFKSDILKISTLSWKQEDYAGKSYNQWKVMQYYSALSLVVLIYLDVQRNASLNYDWSYYNSKYDLDNKRKCLACECIDLDKILTIFGFPFTTCGGGIECMSNEQTFIVEGGDDCTEGFRITETPSFRRVTEDGEPRIIEP